MREWHQVGQQRPEKIVAHARRPERGVPVSRTFLPLKIVECANLIELAELFLSGPVDARVMHFGGGVDAGRSVADCDGNRDGSLNSKHIFGPSSSSTFATEIDDPHFIR